MKYVISLGGSIIVPNEIDTKFINAFARLVSQEVKKGHQFFIITGGGATARTYISAAKKIGKISNRDLDMIGIAATKINAELLKRPFVRLRQKVKIFAGDKPGRSTDYESVRLAARYGVKTVVNLSNIDFVYDSDPRKNSHAKKFEKLTWRQFRKLFGSRWDPGANVPFDPVAAAFAQKQGIEVVVLNGRNFLNLNKFFAGEPFRGTRIR